MQTEMNIPVLMTAGQDIEDCESRLGAVLTELSTIQRELIYSDDPALSETGRRLSGYTGSLQRLKHSAGIMSGALNKTVKIYRDNEAFLEDWKSAHTVCKPGVTGLKASPELTKILIQTFKLRTDSRED